MILGAVASEVSFDIDVAPEFHGNAIGACYMLDAGSRAKLAGFLLQDSGQHSAAQRR